MKIGIEAQRIFREKKHGMEIVAIECLKELQKIDTQNEYVVFVRNGIDKNVLFETRNFRINEFDSFSFPHWEQIELVRQAKNEKIDLMHCTSNTGPIYSGNDMILTLHDIIYLEQLNFKGTPYQNFGNIYRRFIVPRLINKCRFIITVSNYEKNKILDYFKIDENKVKVIYNGVNPIFKTFESDIDHIPDFFTKLPDEFILLFGNTAPKKNTIGALKAYSEYVKMSDNPLKMVITDVKEEFIAKLLKQIGHNGLEKKIEILDYVPYKYMPLLYRRASIFLYPSLRESFGMPVLEAMASGTPVVTSNTSSLPEVSGGAAVLADPFDPMDIAINLSLIISDKKLQDKNITNGLLRVEHFTWENAAQEILNLYNICKEEKEVRKTPVFA